MGARVASWARSLRRPEARPAERLRAFFTEEVWSVRLRDLGRGRALLYRLSRLAYASFRGFLDHRLTVRAAALTYFSALSIVPFLAFAFAVLKGLGAYAAFIDGTVRPYVHRTFGANQALVDAIEQIFRFVDRTNVSTLGALGLLVLVYTSVSLLSSVEDALNEIFGAQTRRSLVRQLTNYVTLLVTTPLLVLVAATFATAAQSSTVVLFLRDTLALGSVISFLLRFTSVAVVWIALFAIYVILPNVHVRIPSALVGAVASAILWQGALVLYVQLQTGVAAYSALYSALGAVPIFLVWTYVSWVIVLVGAQVAASYQGQLTLRQRFEVARVDQDLKETVAVLVAARVVRAFLVGDRHPDEASLAASLDVPEPLVREVVDALARAGVLARAVTGQRSGCVPARDPEGVHLRQLRDALRQDDRAAPLRARLSSAAPPELVRLLQVTDEEAERSAHNVSLRRLAEMIPAKAGDPPAPAAG